MSDKKTWTQMDEIQRYFGVQMIAVPTTVSHCSPPPLTGSWSTVLTIDFLYRIGTTLRSNWARSFGVRGLERIWLGVRSRRCR